VLCLLGNGFVMCVAFDFYQNFVIL